MLRGKKTLWLCALASLALVLSVGNPAIARKKATAPSAPQKRIASLILTVQPKKGPQYASRLAGMMVSEAQSKRISPYVVATTACIESEFRMVSRPCVGVMQVSPSTARAYYKGYNLHNMRDNVRLGTSELSAHYYGSRNKRLYRLASRSGHSTRLRTMWGRYNGCGPSGGYVDKALRTLKRIETGNPASWKRTISTKGALWK